MEKINLTKIEKMIFVVRGHKVMLDSDLAELYGVETKALNQQVRRNIKRFPSDFMFSLTAEEYHSLKSQIVTSKNGRGGKQKLPMVFTENGLAMLSGVLKSDRAIIVNIAIMRIFTKLRSFLLLEDDLQERVGKLEQSSNALFKVVFERLDDFEEQMAPRLPHNRRKIGLK
jgi:hypothetical protein